MISKHFSRQEFACKCGHCKQDTVDHELITALETLRVLTNKPIIITSGNRCSEYNLAVGGASSSQHIWSKAADIIVKDTTTGSVFDILDGLFPNTYGIGMYRGWTHIDVRETKARWDKT